jgi:hypothetical protein
MLGIIALLTIIGFSMAACDNDPGNGNGNGNGGLPPVVGTNEFLGKTLYSGSHEKIIFATTGTSFERYEDWDTSDGYMLFGNGSYSYNSENKTISISIEKLTRSFFYGLINYNDANKNELLTKTQAENAMNASIDAYVKLSLKEYLKSYWNYDDDDVAWVEEEYGVSDVTGFYILLVTYEMGIPVSNLAGVKAAMRSRVEDEFSTTTYDYQIATDDALLVQEKLPANKGTTDELKGKAYKYYGANDSEYVFAASGNTYTYKSGGDIRATGSYAYDSSTAKRVYFRPEKVNNMTILEYYDEQKNNGPTDAASQTNSRFRIDQTKYNPSDLKLGWGENGGDGPPPPEAIQSAYQGTYNVYGYYNYYTQELMPWDSLTDLSYASLKAGVPTKIVLDSNSITFSGGQLNGQSGSGRTSGSRLYASDGTAEIELGTFNSGDFHWTYMLDYASQGAYVLYKK